MLCSPDSGCKDYVCLNPHPFSSQEIKKENLETDGESIGAPATAASEAMDVDSNGKSRGTGDGNFTSGKEGDDESSGDSSDGGHAAAKEIGEEVMKKASRKDDDDDEEEECEMDGEEAGGEEEEDDEDKSQRFRACRPVMPACATWEVCPVKLATCPQLQANNFHGPEVFGVQYPQVPGASDKAQAYEDVLYCNENFFVAVRLHEILYKRLQAAKKCVQPGRCRVS